ncbi:MAG: hypothetical protein WCK89_18985, partial [bacterium]
MKKRSRNYFYLSKSFVAREKRFKKKSDFSDGGRERSYGENCLVLNGQGRRRMTVMAQDRPNWGSGRIVRS